MKNLLKNFVTIISVFLLAVIHFGSPASAKDLVIMTSLPSMEFPFFVHMQKQLDQEARRIGGIKIMAADGQNRVPKQTADVESAIIQAAIQGTDGGMDPKGDCDECTEEEIRKAVEYMLSVVESR